jgi:DNA-binding MarR family transcriptional regulator
LSHSIGYALAQATIVTGRIYTDCIGKLHELRPVEFTLLQLIAATTNVTQKHLCAALGIPAPQMTIVLERLLERGLIDRERAETDRRAQHIRLTPAGQQLAEESRAVSLRAEADALPGLSAAEQAILIELLHKVAAHRTA